jgi:hypothetical protein
MQPDENDIVITSYGPDFTGLLSTVFKFFGNADSTAADLVVFLQSLWALYSFIALSLSALFIVGIIYAYVRINQLDEVISENLLEQEKSWRELNDGRVENDRWQSAQTHLASDNPNDWKLAIIEADVLLDRMLDKAGYAGGTIGEKLRSASVRSFATLDDAWQAHRVRNQIAHGGADFVLTHKVAKETLILYERVFKEFDYI